MNSFFLRLTGVAAALGLGPVSAQTLVGPSPYLSFADSPLQGAANFSYFHLETFESGSFTPGWSANAGWTRLAPSALTDSVDADDGLIDGSGAGGSSFYSGGIAAKLIVTFDGAVLGGLPTHVGVVWTDVGFASPNLGLANFSFEAFDFAGLSLGVIGPVSLGDGSALSSTAEDRFFGAIFSGGISRLELTAGSDTGSEIVGRGPNDPLAAPSTRDWEVDHLQYGRAAPVIVAVPEPAAMGTIAAIALGAVGLFRSRRRTKRLD